MPIIKEKKPSGLVFSLCKMSVEMDGLKEPDSSHRGAAGASGALVGVHRRCPRASASILSLEHSIKVGIRGRRPAAPSWSPESQTADLPLPHCFPSGVWVFLLFCFVFFIVPLSNFKGVHEWCLYLFFFFFLNKLKTVQSFSVD